MRYILVHVVTYFLAEYILFSRYEPLQGLPASIGGARESSELLTTSARLDVWSPPRLLHCMIEKCHGMAGASLSLTAAHNTATEVERQGSPCALVLLPIKLISVINLDVAPTKSAYNTYRQLCKV